MGPPASWWRRGWGLRVCCHHLPLETSAQPSGHSKDCCWVAWQCHKKHYCVVQFGNETGDAAMKSYFAIEGLGTTSIKTGRAHCAGSTALEERKAWESETKQGGEESFGGLVFRTWSWGLRPRAGSDLVSDYGDLRKELRIWERCLMARRVKNLPAVQETQETQVQSLGWEDPLE